MEKSSYTVDSLNVDTVDTMVQVACDEIRKEGERKVKNK